MSVGAKAVSKVRWWSVVLVALVITGCATKLVYRNLDWFILEYVDDYVSLDRDQEQIVKVQLESLIDWHQQQELDAYLGQIDEILALELTQVTDQDLQYHSQQFSEHIYRLANRIAPDIYALSQLATDEQLEQFLENYNNKGQERQQEYLDMSADERMQERKQKMLDNSERWLGDLTDAQVQLVNEWAENRVDNRNLWHAHRVAMGDRMKTMFARRFDVVNYQAEMMSMLTEPEKYYSSELDQQLLRTREINRHYLVLLAHSTTPQQQRYFQEQVFDWRDTINSLKK